MDNTIGQGIPFQRTRRITGYLVGNLSRFGDAKRAEERDRIKHITAKDREKEKEVIPYQS